MRPPDLCQLLQVLLVLLLCAERCVAVKWLALYRIKQRPWDRTSNCSARGTGLVSRQLPMCRDNLELMPTVVHSALVSVETCQQQFKDSRWNCSSILLVKEQPKDLHRGTREQAYVYGIASSALVHSVSRSCSIGVSSKCSCGVLPKDSAGDNFRWDGCGDNVKFGLRFSERFTDATLRSKKGIPRASKKAMMNRHNFRVGRKVVSESLGKACKCHGVSGSCSVKTCWIALPNFVEIGKKLKERFKSAVEVKRKRRKKDKKKYLVPIHKKDRDTFREDELVFYEKSPDYCNADYKTGSIGTKERLCNPSHHSSSSGCGSMCCGRGYYNVTLELVERCKCKYVWCCYVQCQTCNRTLHLSKCR